MAEGAEAHDSLGRAVHAVAHGFALHNPKASCGRIKKTGWREWKKLRTDGGEYWNFTGERNLRARKGQGRMKAVVLAGGQEFGQCPLSRQAPRALWPLADRTIIEHVLGALRAAGIGEMAISANGRTHDIMDSLGHHPTPDVTIHYNNKN